MSHPLPVRRGARRALLASSILAAIVLAAFAPHASTLWLWLRLRAAFSIHTLKNRQGLPEFRHDATGVVMVLVPGGRFHMGAERTGKEYVPADEMPRHEVNLDRFLIAKHELSQALWSRIMRSNPSQYVGAELPAETVSWKLAREFCRRTGLKLPTEAQWEYACRAGTETRFAFGERLTPQQARFGIAHGSTESTERIGSGAANAFGLYQMHGNVPEWCEDIYNATFYAQSEATLTNPFCQSGSNQRVLRGGSSSSAERDCRSSYRAYGDPDLDCLIVGLRLAFYPLP